MKLFAATSVIVFCVLAALPATATPSHLSSFESTYPAAVGTRIDSCTLCHTSAPARNSYGTAYANAGHNFASIEAADSDGDGFTNLAEITALTFPGNAADHPAAATGSLTVTLVPAAAVTAGAQWRVGLSGAYQASGATVTGLAVGSVTVQFKAVTGWVTPGDQTIAITTGHTATATGTYTATTGSLTVTLVPAAAVTAGAQWRVGSSGAYQPSGATVAGLAAGSVTVQFKAVVGWATPASQTVTITTGQTGTATGTYTAEQVTVPNVVGQTQAAAATALTAAGLTVGTVTQVYNASISSGQIISQTPAAGGTATAGSAVALTVSKGPQPVTVPNVVGQTQAAASSAITGAGLVVGAVTQRHDATVPNGEVITQTPVAGAQAAPGSAVGLLISQGPGPVAVPDVTGQTQAAAAASIVSAGLLVGNITQEYSSTVPAGQVASQTPSANAQAAAGSAVALVLSQGPQPVAVPDVTGLTQDAATAAIVAAGFTVGLVNNAANDTVASGSVISQIPAAATLAVPGSLINLTVSTGPQSTGCTCLGGKQASFTPDGILKMLGDLFLPGLSLVTLMVMARRKS